MKKILIYGVFLIVLFALTALFFKTNQKSDILNTIPLNKKEVKKEVSVFKIENFKESNTFLEASIDYPSDNILVKDKIFTIYKTFLKENKLDVASTTKKDLGLYEDSEMKYNFDATFEVATSTKTNSYIYTLYTFTGGAHGSTEKIVFAYDLNQKEQGISDTLPDSLLAKVSEISFTTITDELYERMKADPDFAYKNKAELMKADKESVEWVKEGTAPKRENYNTAWVDNQNLYVYFGQYQIWAYAYGDYIVTIPLEKLK
jgi:hypothetical protein